MSDAQIASARQVSEAEVMILWRASGLPEYFLGNGGTNHRLVAFVQACIAAAIPDHKPDLSGLDDGPYLPGCAPRKKPAPKTTEELREIRAKAWATRHARAQEAT